MGWGWGLGAGGWLTEALEGGPKGERERERERERENCHRSRTFYNPTEHRTGPTRAGSENHLLSKA